MTIKYLMDENVDPIYSIQLRQQHSNFVVWSVGDPATPAKGAKDPEILIWCEEYEFILVTNNRKSMPVHLADHLNQDRHIPGIFILSPNLSVGQNLDELALIAQYSFEDEYLDRIVHIPLT